MLKANFFLEGSTTKRDFFLFFFLLVNTFTWYYSTLVIIEQILHTFDVSFSNMVRIAYFSSIALSSLIGATISSKVKRLNMLYFWMILGTFSSLLPIFGKITMPYASIILLLLGVSFGFGMPASLGYFADYTTIENRGRSSGIIFLITNLSVLPIVATSMQLDLISNSLTSALWRGLGFFIFYALKPKERDALKKRKSVSFSVVFNDHYFVLYVIPWFMFSFIDLIEDPILGNFFGLEFYRSIFIIKPIIGGISAFISGLLSDAIGRKRIVVYGFIALGLAYAAIGISPTLLISWYFYQIVDSIAAGILWTMFILILWGDLARPDTREKYYAIGNLPFSLASIPPLLIAPYINLIPAYATFSLASFFLFLAVLPLMYASETLPEKKIELRRLKGYVEQAKKVKEKQL